MKCKDCIHLGKARSQSSKSGYKPWCLHQYISPVLDDDIICPEYTSVKRITNGDRIRQMSNKEIVDWIGGNDERLCSFSCPPCQVECNDDCRGCWLGWLNSEYKEVEK